MDRYNPTRDSSRYSFETQNVVPLKILNLISLVLGVLTLSISIFSYVRLQQSSDVFSMCTPQLIKHNLEGAIGCQKFSDWNVLVIAAIIVSVLQVGITAASVFWKWAQSRTNVWCAIHGLVFVVFSPILVFSLISCQAFGDKNKESFFYILSSGNQKFFAALVGSDLTFSLFGLVFVSLFYGLEVHFGYRRLISTENSYA
ncbi:unnamed protein product [Allacma fusca]|uniref:Uncharacterized protein n=1 Tax=Allacma fusca TaxID=39272 RepID=A0A8J2Q001_9HEXA|nr:unnamed protein product [Allacma fusca]